jgi:hypothetical protein
MGIFSSGIPIPVSLTETRILASPLSFGSPSTEIRTCPLGVNLIALPTRFVITWRILPPSPMNCVACRTVLQDQMRFFSCALGASIWVTSFDHRVQVEWKRFDLQLTGLHFREIEDVVDHRQQSLARRLTISAQLLLFRCKVGVEEESGHASVTPFIGVRIRGS